MSGFNRQPQGKPRRRCRDIVVELHSCGCIGIGTLATFDGGAGVAGGELQRVVVCGNDKVVDEDAGGGGVGSGDAIAIRRACDFEAEGLRVLSSAIRLDGDGEGRACIGVGEGETRGGRQSDAVVGIDRTLGVAIETEGGEGQCGRVIVSAWRRRHGDGEFFGAIAAAVRLIDGCGRSAKAHTIIIIENGDGVAGGGDASPYGREVGRLGDSDGDGLIDAVAVVAGGDGDASRALAGEDGERAAAVVADPCRIGGVGCGNDKVAARVGAAGGGEIKADGNAVCGSGMFQIHIDGNSSAILIDIGGQVRRKSGGVIAGGDGEDMLVCVCDDVPAARQLGGGVRRKFQRDIFIRLGEVIVKDGETGGCLPVAGSDGEGDIIGLDLVAVGVFFGGDLDLDALARRIPVQLNNRSGIAASLIEKPRGARLGKADRPVIIIKRDGVGVFAGVDKDTCGRVGDGEGRNPVCLGIAVIVIVEKCYIDRRCSLIGGKGDLRRRQGDGVVRVVLGEGHGDGRLGVPVEGEVEGRGGAGAFVALGHRLGEAHDGRVIVLNRKRVGGVRRNAAPSRRKAGGGLRKREVKDLVELEVLVVFNGDPEDEGLLIVDKAETAA